MSEEQNTPIESVSENKSATINALSVFPCEVPVDLSPVITPIDSVITQCFVPTPSVLNSSSSSPNFFINEFLVKWAVEFNISHSAVNGLLKGLKEHRYFNNFPVDSRKLFKWPSNTPKKIRIVEPGLLSPFWSSKWAFKICSCKYE